MQKKVTLLIRIRVGKRYPFAEPVYSANGELKPLCAMVDGRPEHHREGTYHLRYHRKIHPSVGNHADEAITALARKEIELRAATMGMHIPADRQPADANRLFQLNEIPMFNEDDEKHPPASVVELKKRIRSADAVLIVTPEYNYSILGVLKNAIDWASRPHGDSAWSGKPAAIMGATLGAVGTARAQQHLRQIFVALNLFLLNKPEVVIADAAHRFNEDGNLIDDPTKQLIQELLKNWVDWTRRISSALAREASP